VKDQSRLFSCYFLLTSGTRIFESKSASSCLTRFNIKASACLLRINQTFSYDVLRIFELQYFIIFSVSQFYCPFGLQLAGNKVWVLNCAMVVLILIKYLHDQFICVMENKCVMKCKTHEHYSHHTHNSQVTHRPLDWNTNNYSVCIDWLYNMYMTQSHNISHINYFHITNKHNIAGTPAIMQVLYV